MKKYYYTLSKEKKKEIKEQYKKEYTGSDVAVRLLRLKIYAIIGYLFSIVILAYSFKFEKSQIGSIIMAVTLITVSTVYVIGSIIVKMNLYNKIALKNKKK